MKKGFTLAEVLITLAIIGVVAALTIPAVVHKYQQHAQYTAFMKMYNTLANTIDLAQGEYGSPSTWNFDSDNPYLTVQTYIYPYLKTSTICDNSSDAGCVPSYNLTTLNGEDSFTMSDMFEGNDNLAVLQDGSIVTFFVSGGDNIRTIVTYFDTNGSKGPNVMGRDFFMLAYEQDETTQKWGFNFSDDFAAENCTLSSSGNACGAKLLQDGKMDY